MFLLSSKFFAPDGPLTNNNTPVVNDGGSDFHNILSELQNDETGDEEVIDLGTTVKKGKEKEEKVEEEEKPELDDDGKPIVKEEDEEEDELKALEEELAEPTDEQLESMTPARRKDILKKYPTLFKDFPYLEKAYYREQQFTQVFPTIEEAKEASVKAGVLNNFENDLLKGNTVTILKGVKQQDELAFY